MKVTARVVVEEGRETLHLLRRALHRRSSPPNSFRASDPSGDGDRRAAGGHAAAEAQLSGVSAKSNGRFGAFRGEAAFRLYRQNPPFWISPCKARGYVPTVERAVHLCNVVNTSSGLGDAFRMGFQDLLDILTPDNRERLTWIGSGIAAVAGAIWVATNAFVNRRRSDQPNESRGAATFQADHTYNVSNAGNQSHIANVGGNVSVVQTFGVTVSRFAVVLLLIGLLLLAIGIAANWFISSGAEAAALPRVSFSIGCGRDNSSIQTVLPATPDEAKSIAALLEIGNRYPNQIVYASIEVNKPCGSCQCYRLDEKNSRNSKRADKYNPKNTIGYIEMEWAGMFQDIPETDGNLMITAMIYERMAARHSFFLPAANQIPRNELYLNDTIKSKVIAYSGPFHVENNYDTGWGYVKLSPLKVVDDNLRRRLRCSQPDLSWRAKLIDRCAPVPSPAENN